MHIESEAMRASVAWRMVRQGSEWKAGRVARDGHGVALPGVGPAWEDRAGVGETECRRRGGGGETQRRHENPC